jgi:kumamolisin
LGQGTTGGTSTMFAQPAWQVGQGLPKPTSQEPRQVPDVSAVGDPTTGTAIYEGQWEQGGGTSLATPIWAGFAALIDQYLKHNGKPPVGYLNPYLYYFADHPRIYAPLHLVTTGGNNVWRNTNGYNESTGLGTPDVYNLARDLLAQESSR